MQAPSSLRAPRLKSVGPSSRERSSDTGPSIQRDHRRADGPGRERDQSVEGQLADLVSIVSLRGLRCSPQLPEEIELDEDEEQCQRPAATGADGGDASGIVASLVRSQA